MGFFDLRVRLKFTTDCVRYNSAHFIAMWWVKEDGEVWSPNNNRPILYLVRKGTSNNYNLREATNFDINLNIQDVFVPSYNCRVHVQCNNHKLRVMVIPVCKIPNLSTYNQFETAFNNAVAGTTYDGGYYYIRLDNDSSYSSSYASMSTVLIDYITNNLSVTNQSFGESITDIDIVNSVMKDCRYSVVSFSNQTSITTGNPNDYYTICGSKTNSGILITQQFNLFPNPIDNGNPIANFDLGTFGINIGLCHKSLSFSGELFDQSYSYDNLQYPISECCNTYETFNVSVSRPSGVSSKYFVFYQDANPASSTFLQFVNIVLVANDPSNYSDSATIVAIPGSLYIVKVDTINSLVYNSASYLKNITLTFGSDTLTVIKQGINKIQCP